ncbi:hypothetical protein [uncultured Roseobacter sp.]|uniref:hypothetical protein n=1 Tax=uncultured Roseobacter sp. TaxID=114847 RepID=UPI00261A6AAB|nr:hypothetical protein [uncultured Roseobacter sp.]
MTGKLRSVFIGRRYTEAVKTERHLARRSALQPAPQDRCYGILGKQMINAALSSCQINSIGDMPSCEGAAAGVISHGGADLSDHVGDPVDDGRFSIEKDIT